MELEARAGCIPPGLLQGGLALRDLDTLLRAHGASVRSVDNHHWQISRGDRSGLWLLGDGAARGAAGLDPGALERLQGVLRQTGLLQDQEPAAAHPAPMDAAILWVGNEATRVYWINQQGLGGEGAQSISHWLQGEITLHRQPPTATYLRRIVAMLERIERALLIGRQAETRTAPVVPANGDGSRLERPGSTRGTAGTLLVPAPGPDGLARLTRLLERERPDLRRRVVAILTIESDRLDDALLFAMAQRYLHPHPCGSLR